MIGCTVRRFALGFLAAIVCCDAFVVACSDDQDPDEYSFSAKQARAGGTLISRVSMNPNSIKWRKWEITVGDAWLEKGKKGGYYLCFRIVKGQEAIADLIKGGFFVLGDSQAGVKLHLNLNANLVQAVQYLDSPDLSKVRFSFIDTWQEKRLKNIRFVPLKQDAPRQ